MSDTRTTLLTQGTQALSQTSPSPRLDCEILLCFALKIERIQLLSRPDTVVSTEDTQRFLALIDRRRKNEPIAYITGVKEFYGLEFVVSPAVLVPRPETELIVEQILQVAKRSKGPFRLLDLGTGSGCIPIAIACELANAGVRTQAVGVDSSAAALTVAKKNADRLGVSELVHFAQSNWCNAIGTKSSWHCIVSNPPYIPNGAQLAKDLAYEPDQALFAGEDGLDAYREIFPIVASRIGADGMFIAEIGQGQGASLAELWRGYSKRPVEIKTDLAGLERIFVVP